MLLADRSDMLATALRSPEAARAHDRAGWLGLFTDDGTVIDPVGSRPHCGRAALGKFYDTFIGPRDIAFSCDADVVSGRSVFRDVTLAVQMAESVAVDVPAILRYDLVVERSALRVAQLRAYWELPPMIVALVRTGLAAAPVGVALSAAMLRNQGLSGTAGFLAAFRRPGRRDVETLRRIVDDVSGAGTHIPQLRSATIDGRDVVVAELAATLRGVRGRKFIAAGSTVAAVLDHDTWRGFIFAEFDRSTLTSVEVVTEAHRGQSVH